MSSSGPLLVPDMRPCGRLSGDTVIVTGAGSAGEMPGTGAAMAILFAAEGANVVVLDRDVQRAEHTLDAIEAIGGSGDLVEADITDPQQCRDAVDVTIARFGSIDALVNNAAIAPGEEDETERTWNQVLSVNLHGAKLMADAVLGSMRQTGRGSIVMISSVAAMRGGAGLAYSSAKAGMIGLARALAFQHGRDGVRVNAIAPGHVAVPMGLGYAGWDEGTNVREMRASAGLLGVEGTGWDVAYAALFLVSEESRYITAATLPVDAGTTQVMPIVMHDYLASARDRRPPQ